MNVGDYVRTKDGYISKIKELGINVYTDIGCWSEEYVVKSSPNIIDVIEAEDYVNGYKVLEICEGNFESNNPHNVKALKLEFIEQNINSNIPFFKRYIFILNENIKSIVTKEQFESIQYKIK